MSEEHDFSVSPDKVSTNVLSETIAKGVVAVSGIATSSILVRTTGISWTLADYGKYRVLMYWYSFLVPLVLFGLTTAVIKSIAEQSNKKDEIGPTMSTALLFVTISFLILSFFTLFLADSIGFLAQDTLAETLELRALWIVVLLSILPSAYLYIFRSFFTGIQRNKNALYADIAYHVSRVALIAVLFLLEAITTINVLYIFLITTIIGFGVGLTIFTRGMRKEGIGLSLRINHSNLRILLRIGSVFVTLSLLASFSNNIVPLLVDYFGTSIDIARYSMADKLIQTTKAFIYAPYAVLLPNIAAMHATGRKEDLQNRFRNSYRIIVPMLLFITLAMLTLGTFALGTLYGVRALDTTYGLAASEFLFIMAPLLFIAPLGGIYSNLMIATDKMKALLAIGSFSVLSQVLWILLLQPLFGVLAIAYSWIAAIPVVVFYHFYSRKKISLYIEGRYFLKLIPVSVIFLLVAWVAAYFVDIFVNGLSFLPFLDLNSVSSFVKLLIGIPLWYAFLGIALLGGILHIRDLENLKKFIRTVPPFWWISKPILGLIERVYRKWILIRTR